MSKTDSKAATDMTEAASLSAVSCVLFCPVKYFFHSSCSLFRWRKRCSGFKGDSRLCLNSWSPKISFFCKLFRHQPSPPRLQLVAPVGGVSGSVCSLWSRPEGVASADPHLRAPADQSRVLPCQTHTCGNTHMV